MFSRLAVNAGKAVRSGAVRGLIARSAPAAMTVLPARPFVQANRSFSALAEVLATELLEAENDQQVDQDLRDVTKEISKMFAVKDEPGSAHIKLSRKYKSEEIEVQFHCQDENTDFNAPDGFAEDAVETEESEEDMGGEYGVDFSVTVSRGGNKMEFLCNAGQTININQMRYVPAGTGDSDDALESLYRGPQFDNLDETLQDSLLEYLAERGIGDDMSFFIISYSRDKEEREYQRWLKQFIKFAE